MTSRAVLATKIAVAQHRIESVLPEEVVQALPMRTEERQVALMEYIADALERRSKKSDTTNSKSTASDTSNKSAASDK